MKRLLPVLLLCGTAHAIDPPEIQIQASGDFWNTYIDVAWRPVAGANKYNIYFSNHEMQDSLIGFTSDTLFTFEVPNQWSFSTPTRIGYIHITSENTGGLTLIPPGTFTMGDSFDDEPLTPNDHTVQLTNSYLLGTNEITNAEYIDALQWAYDNGLVTADISTVTVYGMQLVDLSDNGSEIMFSGGTFSLRESTDNYTLEAYPGGYDPANHPVSCVSWFGAACYCDWLSMQFLLEPFYCGNWAQNTDHNPYESEGYRLPTDAEWEFAAVFQDDRKYPWGDDPPECEIVNFAPTGNDCIGWTTPVGSYPEGMSQLGLLDLAGNVWEWTGSHFGDHPSFSVNPLGPDLDSNAHRKLKGGQRRNDERDMRCAMVISIPPEIISPGSLGFRVCRTVID